MLFSLSVQSIIGATQKRQGLCSFVWIFSLSIIAGDSFPPVARSSL
jgi:hypothetical protein